MQYQIAFIFGEKCVFDWRFLVGFQVSKSGGNKSVSHLLYAAKGETHHSSFHAHYLGEKLSAPVHSKPIKFHLQVDYQFTIISIVWKFIFIKGFKYLKAE